MTVVTSLEEIRVQAAPEIVELPGFRPGAVIHVQLRMIDLTPRLLELRVSNPLLAEVQKMAQSGMDKDDIAHKIDTGSLKDILPLLEEISRDALVQPTYDDIVAIHPLTLSQKMKIFEYVVGGVTAPAFRT